MQEAKTSFAAQAAQQFVCQHVVAIAWVESMWDRSAVEMSIESLSKIQICVNNLTNDDRSPSQQTDDPMNEAALRVACAPRWAPSADLSTARSLKNGLSMDEEVTRRAASTARLQQDYITAYDHEDHE